MKKMNISAAFDRIDECWSPHIAARVNRQKARLTKIEGAFDWHHHDGVDELFLVVKGRFTMRFRAKDEQWDVAMEEGDLLVVPAGAEHMPVAEEECWILKVENAGPLNTGDRETPRTRRVLPEI